MTHTHRPKHSHSILLSAPAFGRIIRSETSRLRLIIGAVSRDVRLSTGRVLSSSASGRNSNDSGEIVEGSDRGYIALHRRIDEHPLWTQLPSEWYKIWTAVLLRANWKPGKINNRGTGASEIPAPCGSFHTSIESFARYCNVTPKQVRGAFQYFKRAKMVAIERASNASLVTVSNWAVYQPSSVVYSAHGANERANLGALSGQTEGKPRATSKEGNKGIILSGEVSPTTPTTGGVLWEDLPFGDIPTAAEAGPTWDEMLEARIMSAASNIHKRHPALRRDISANAVAEKLRSICRMFPKSARPGKPGEIDGNHEAWCQTEAWSKENGNFAKGLDNWLAPTKRRWEAGPAKAQPYTSPYSPASEDD